MQSHELLPKSRGHRPSDEANDRSTRSHCVADAMDVFLSVLMDVVDEHYVDMRDVQAMAGDVCGYQSGAHSRVKLGKDLQSFRLCHEIVNEYKRDG